jgi:hypothetical protein
MNGLATLVLALILPWLSSSLILHTLMKSNSSAHQNAHWALSLGSGYLLGMMLSAAMLWLGAQLGGTFYFWSALGLWLILLLATLVWTRPWQNVRPNFSPPAIPIWQKLFLGLFLTLIALRLTSLGIEITHQAMPAWDAWIIWAERAKNWFYLGQLAPYVPTETWLNAPSGSYESEAAHYPILVSLIHLWAALALGRWDEALVNLPWLGAGIALALTLYGALRSSHIPAWLTLGGVWMLLSLPILNTQIAIAGYADLWLTLAYSQLIFGLLLWIGARQRAALILILLGLFSLPLIKHQVWLLLLASTSPLLIWAIFIAIPPRLRIGFGVALCVGTVLFLALNLSNDHLHLPVLGDISLQATQLVLPGLGKVAPDFGSIAEPMLFHLFILDSWHMLWGISAFAWLILIVRLLRQNPHDLTLIALNISLLSNLLLYALSYASPRVLPFIIDGTLVNRGLLYLAPLLIFVIIHALNPTRVDIDISSSTTK